MQKRISDIAIDFSSSSNRILFSTMILASTYAISILILLLSSLFLSSSSIFVFGAEPGMASPPPTTTPSPPPATTTGEKPGIVPVPPPPPTASTAINKLLGVLPITPPIVEQKTDPKDGDTILSSKIKTDTTVVTKVDKKSDKKTLGWNRGYLDGIKWVFNPSKEFNLTPEQLQKKLLNPTSGLSRSEISKYGEDYVRGVVKGVKDALILDDMLSVIAGEKSQ